MKIHPSGRHHLTPAAGLAVTLLVAGCSESRQKPSRYASPIFATRTHSMARATHYDPRPMYAAPARQSDYLRPRPSPPPPPRAAARVNNSAWVPPGGFSDRWTDIVIHHSASDSGGAVAFDRHHRMVNKWDELGYHFVIGNGTDTGDGEVEVGSRWTKQKHGAHCKTPDNYYNNHGIGICLVGNFEHSQPSPRQMASLERLVRFLEQQCNIPPDHVRTHGGVTGRTACPGRYFPLAQLRNDLQMHAVYSRAR